MSKKQPVKKDPKWKKFRWAFVAFVVIVIAGFIIWKINNPEGSFF